MIKNPSALTPSERTQAIKRVAISRQLRKRGLVVDIAKNIQGDLRLRALRHARKMMDRLKIKE